MEVTRQIPYFKPVYVFDVDQTEGEPLPQLVHELDGSVDSYNELMAALREISPVPIEFEEIPGAINGYADFKEKRIAIKADLSQSHTIKTTIHEISHADLHFYDVNSEAKDRLDKRTMEVEAESLAFVISSFYGLDTSDYSFPYIASWSKNKELSELKSSLNRIQNHAGNLIERIDGRLLEMQKEREQITGNAYNLAMADRQARTVAIESADLENYRRPFSPAKEQYELLNALYSGIVTHKRNPDDEALRESMREKFKDYAKELDTLKVPFAVQNAVAGAADKRENWFKYNNSVIMEVCNRPVYYT